MTFSITEDGYSRKDSKGFLDIFVSNVQFQNKSFIKINIYLPQAYVTMAEFGYPVYDLFGLLVLIRLSNIFTLGLPDEDHARTRRVYY